MDNDKSKRIQFNYSKNKNSADSDGIDADTRTEDKDRTNTTLPDLTDPNDTTDPTDPTDPTSFIPPISNKNNSSSTRTSKLETVDFESVNKVTWNIINKYFEDNPQCLVSHHLESYDDFFKNGIYKIFQEKNPVKIFSGYDETIHDYRYQCELYFGGKNGNKIYFGKPNIYDKDNEHYMFPNEARLRNMDYSMTIHYDVDVEFIDILKEGERPNLVGGNGIDISNFVGEGGDNEEAKIEGGKLYTNYKTGGDQYGESVLTVGGGGSGEKLGTEAKPNPRKKKKSINVADVDPNMASIILEATAKSVVNNIQRRQMTLSKIYLGKFPIMVQSSFCILNGMPKEVRFNTGECKNDMGGYFIIGGKEKVVVPQEKFADNMLYIRSYLDDEHPDNEMEIGDLKYLYSAEIRSVSENSSKPIRTFSIRLVAPSVKYTNENIVVAIPNVRKPVPLFIVFRALGFISDKEIIEMCLLDLEKYESMVDLFIPSVHDAGGVLNQLTALKYIASLTKGKTITHAIEILTDYILPHIGETNYTQKAYYLGYMVFRLFSVKLGFEPKTDRDNFKYKRVELIGTLIYELFREYYNIQQKEIYVDFEKTLYYHQNLYETDLKALIEQNYRTAFSERTLELGFKKAFKGNWGAYSHTKRVGIVQDLNRLSFNTYISHLRKITLPIDSGLKIVGPRLLHNSQWGFIDPIDTPDGGNIGLHKSLAITTQITRGFSREPLLLWLRENISLILLESCKPFEVSKMTKVFVNGYWAGCVTQPFDTVEKIKLYRRHSLIPIYVSVTFDIKYNTIYIYTDDGRLCRPIFYVESKDTKKVIKTSQTKDPPVASFEKNTEILRQLKDGDFQWSDLVAGFQPKTNNNFSLFNGKIYTIEELYSLKSGKISDDKRAIIDIIDSSETENTMIAVNYDDLKTKTLMKYTHCEIHESLLLGVMCNQIAFPENNPLPRDLFSSGQSKQACSMYHTNYQVRMDKTAVVLNYGQRPLIKSQYLKYINNEENPYGVNAIVAIMCYTGYNVEDAILINEASIKRGLFQTTYYSTYETHEEKSKEGDTVVNKQFSNIENDESVTGTKAGYDYSKLDSTGIIREGTYVNDKTILIGLTSNNGLGDGKRTDDSKKPKKGQLGVVDKTFITEGETGERIAKVRICEQRIPTLGDKFASTVGQKGTIGMVIPESDMPFTINGIRPDMIINPHALPSRMTIGQLISSITGKACLMYGGFGDCTAFNQRGTKVHFYGEQLSRATMDGSRTTTDDLLKAGFHSTGNEIMYNGMTGEQIESEIFIGPTYYMRLKHMVKDKINYRASGPRSNLTRQPVSGRANDGGLRVGEMEKDSILSHGMSAFLKDAMMEKGDKYYMAVCNQSGMIAIYNSSKNHFLSTAVDGPLKFSIDLENQMHLETVSRFGRNFSIVAVPYAFKLFIQEMATMGVQLRLITDDNIKQFENLSFGGGGGNGSETNNMKFKEYSKYIGERMRNPTAEAKPFNPYQPSTIEEYGIDAMDTDSFFDKPIFKSRSNAKIPPSVSPPASPQFNPFEFEDLTDQPITTNGENTNGYSPPYPENSVESPPYPENIFDEPGLYKIGDLVHYRNEKTPGKIYKIQVVTPKYITIVNNNDPNIKEDMKILTVDEAKTDIYPFVEMKGGGNESYSTKIPAGFFGGWGGGQGQGELNNPFSSYEPDKFMRGSVGGGNGNINITPIIHLGSMGGSNNDATLGSNDISMKPNNITVRGGDFNNNNNNNKNGGGSNLNEINGINNGGEGIESSTLMDGLKTVGGILVKKLGGL